MSVNLGIAINVLPKLSTMVWNLQPQVRLTSSWHPGRSVSIFLKLGTDAFSNNHFAKL